MDGSLRDLLLAAPAAALSVREPPKARISVPLFALQLPAPHTYKIGKFIFILLQLTSTHTSSTHLPGISSYPYVQSASSNLCSYRCYYSVTDTIFTTPQQFTAGAPKRGRFSRGRRTWLRGRVSCSCRNREKSSLPASRLLAISTTVNEQRCSVYEEAIAS